MAFAGNDLVNFIGVPLAGLKSFQEFQLSGSTASDFPMTILATKVKTPTIYLLIAGLIMVVTLWLSKKARSVTETEINLARQNAGYERFGSTLFSRSIVRSFVNFRKSVGSILPNIVKSRINNRFSNSQQYKNGQEKADSSAFDLIRASVNLVMASILISIGTSMKLPLSTTYVTFMVAMGTSLADGAWGLESAVYRVTGVISVIAGWFVTALVAFTFAFLIANLVNWGSTIAIIVLLIIAILLVIRSRSVHRKRALANKKIKEQEENNKAIQEENIFETCVINVTNTINDVTDIYNRTLEALKIEDRKALKKANKKSKALNKGTKLLKNNIHSIITQLRDDSIETGHYYVQVLDYLREISNAILFISKPAFEHIDNNHAGLIESQWEDLKNLQQELNSLLDRILQIVKTNNFAAIQELSEKQQELLSLINKLRKRQLKRVKNLEVGTKNSILYLNLLAETKNIILFTNTVLKSQRDFVENKESLETLI
jgi:hypothetical protein